MTFYPFPTWQAEGEGMDLKGGGRGLANGRLSTPGPRPAKPWGKDPLMASHSTGGDRNRRDEDEAEQSKAESANGYPLLELDQSPLRIGDRSVEAAQCGKNFPNWRFTFFGDDWAGAESEREGDRHQQPLPVEIQMQVARQMRHTYRSVDVPMS